MQTRVPITAQKAAKDAAAEEGISMAAWLGKLVLERLGYDGKGRKVAK